MSKALLVTGSHGTIVVANSTRYLPLGNAPLVVTATTANAQVKFRSTGTLSNLYVRIEANTLEEDAVIRVRRNGALGSAGASVANGNQTVTVLAGATGEFEDITNTDTVADGDTYNYSIVTLSGVNTRLTVASCIFNANDDTVQKHVASGFPALAGREYWYAITDNAVSANTAVDMSAQMAATAVVKNLFVKVSANGLAGNTTISILKNSTTTLQSVIVPGGGTGTYEDTTNHLLAENDAIMFVVSVPTEAGLTITPAIVSCEIVTVDKKFHLIYAQASGMASQAFTTIRFMPIGGGGALETTEENVKSEINLKATASRLGVYVSANSIAA